VKHEISLILSKTKLGISHVSDLILPNPELFPENGQDPEYVFVTDATEGLH
jgi:hypothetical protein